MVDGPDVLDTGAGSVGRIVVFGIAPLTAPEAGGAALEDGIGSAGDP